MTSESDVTAAMAAPETGVPAGDEPVMKVANNSTFGPMLWIGFYTTLLNIVTLTLFRFWGRSQFRRRLWAETSLDGEPLEYTGTGKELFIGFLIAIFSIMIPFLLLLLVAQLAFGEVGFVIVYILLYLALLPLIGMALFLARRYHLSRTRLRGVRFAQTGSAIEYGLKFFGYLLLTIISLGWMGPMMRLKLSEYMWSRSYYGDQKFTFAETAESAKEPVYPSFALSWFGGVVLYLIWYAIIIGYFVAKSQGSGDFSDFESDPDALIEMLIVVYGTLIPLSLLLVLFMSWHEAVMIRKIIKSLHVAGAQMTSTMTTKDIMWLSISNALIVIFTLGFGFMVAQMRTWRKIANTMEVHGAVDFDAIQQTADKGPSQGEGLADGLDLISNF